MKHYHYAWPHGSPCENPACPSWCPRVLPDGRCDNTPPCDHCHPEATP